MLHRIDVAAHQRLLHPFDQRVGRRRDGGPVGPFMAFYVYLALVATLLWPPPALMLGAPPYAWLGGRAGESAALLNRRAAERLRHRGEVTVLDRAALEAEACSCYAADKQIHAELTVHRH